MIELNAYLKKRGIAASEMEEARAETQAYIEAYNLREARRASNMTQVQVAQAIGASQNRISRMENGDMGAMSIDSLWHYLASLGPSEMSRPSVFATRKARSSSAVCLPFSRVERNTVEHPQKLARVACV